MQPRRRASFVPGEIVFQVTKRGCWVSGPVVVFVFGRGSRELPLLVALLAVLVPLGVERALCRLLELVVLGEGARRRDKAAGLYARSASASASASEASSDEAVVVLYFSHSVSTSSRDSEGRFSRLAARLSKQYAQWAWVAMVGWRQRRGGGMRGCFASSEVRRRGIGGVL